MAKYFLNFLARLENGDVLSCMRETIRTIQPTILPPHDVRGSQEDWNLTTGTLEEGDSGSRILNLTEAVNPNLAHRVVLQLLNYETEDPGKPIHLYLFSPGGCVPSGLAIIDTMQHLTSPVFTYCIGYAASMAAVILAAGRKGHRYILPRSRVMIHQASGSVGGTMDNVRATLAFQSSLENDIEQILASCTGQTVDVIRAASRVDNWMDAPSAASFGLVDHILTPA